MDETWRIFSPNYAPHILKIWPGGVFDLAKVEIEFSVVSDRGKCQVMDAFY